MEQVACDLTRPFVMTVLTYHQRCWLGYLSSTVCKKYKTLYPIHAPVNSAHIHCVRKHNHLDNDTITTAWSLFENIAASIVAGVFDFRPGESGVLLPIIGDVDWVYWAERYVKSIKHIPNIFSREFSMYSVSEEAQTISEIIAASFVAGVFDFRTGGRCVIMHSITRCEPFWLQRCETATRCHRFQCFACRRNAWLPLRMLRARAKTILSRRRRVKILRYHSVGLSNILCR